MSRLEFDSIEISFDGRRILNSVYMACEKGQITGLLGRNGCGKSTLMKIVFGALPLEQKSVRIDDRSLGTHYLSRNLIAYLPQADLIPSYLTIHKAFSLFGVDERGIIGIFPEIYQMMDLRPTQLSGGYRRILEMFLILRSKASFCLLDEPFTGLTPVYIEKVKSMLTESKKDKGILISDHMHRHVVEMSDKLYLLSNGQTYPVHDPEQLVSMGYLSSVSSA